MLLQTKEKLEDLIVKLLAERPILTATQVRQEIKEKNKKYSLQAVYKELRKLQNNGVVSKIKQKYGLRLPWALDFVSLADIISQTYIDSPRIASILPERNKKEIWHFNNLLKMNNFWSHILLILIQQSEKKILLGWNPHPWFHLAQTKQEEQYIKSLGLAKGKLYLIVGGSTYLDRWAEKFFDKKIVEYSFGRSACGTECSPHYINVIDDYVLTVKIDKKTARIIDDLYKNTTSADDIDIASIMDVFHGKINASIWLEKNSKKAQQISGRFSRFFGVKF
ncbi:hypothetical protein KKD19_02875 [Patescibacteria group bacterium]|nr:hypothetical protein [Patescibacteria group bacterium]MBU4512160.1 hypothetical protein [Patescibacteria group bacterium]MCG2693036.1 hypothetical protein [Candidatus Parcubacteria bacterium]